MAAPKLSAIPAEAQGLIVRTYAAVVMVIGLVAVATVIGFAPAARHWLDFGFEGVPRTVSEASSIFMDNARILVAVIAAGFVVNAPWLVVGDGQTRQPGRRWRSVRAVCDVALVLAALNNLVVVGAGIGGYGTKMVMALLPHGPFELLAFCGVIALYLLARRGPVPWRTAAILAGGSVGLLAVAAAAEAFFGPYNG